MSPWACELPHVADVLGEAKKNATKASAWFDFWKLTDGPTTFVTL